MESLTWTQILPLKCLRKRLAWQGDILAGLFCAWRGHLDLDGGESNSRVFKWLIKLSRLLLHAIHFQLFFPIKCNQQIFVKRLVRELKQHSRKGKKVLSRNRGIYLGFVWVTGGSEAKGNAGWQPRVRPQSSQGHYIFWLLSLIIVAFWRPDIFSRWDFCILSSLLYEQIDRGLDYATLHFV